MHNISSKLHPVDLIDLRKQIGKATPVGESVRMTKETKLQPGNCGSSISMCGSDRLMKISSAGQ